MTLHKNIISTRSTLQLHVLAEIQTTSIMLFILGILLSGTGRRTPYCGLTSPVMLCILYIATHTSDTRHCWLRLLQILLPRYLYWTMH